MKKIACLFSFVFCCAVAAENRDVFIDNLMSRMTLEEKIGQLNLLPLGIAVTGPSIVQGVENKIRNGLVGGILNTYTPDAVQKLQNIAVNESRLKIPLIFGFDVIHGHRTIFPMPLALASSWDLPLIEKTARIAAIEASRDGLHWTYSPMVDISRDPRWGRVMESAGEDPYLGSRIAQAMVHGYQGDNLVNPENILASVKHFALYGAVEGGRDYNTVDMSPVRMFNEYLPPYKAAIDANVGTVMSAFNEINGVPATGDHWLMTDILRKTFGFKGFVVSDYNAVIEMQEHGVGNSEEVTRLAINAPVEMDMADEMYSTYLPELVRQKKVSQSAIDNACRLILVAKWNLGLFQNSNRGMTPSQVNTMSSSRATIPSRDTTMSSRGVTAGSTHPLSPEYLEVARQAARKSMVLLKNTNQVLPLRTNQKIAFIGPFVKDQHQQLAEWRAAGDSKLATGLWTALSEKFGKHEFFYAQGANFSDDAELVNYLNTHNGQLSLKDSKKLQREAVSVAQKSDVIVAVLGEPFGMSGEASSRTDIGLLNNQLQLLKALKKLKKPIVLVLMNGRPLTLGWENENMDAILEAWYGGTQAGPALVEVLFGDYNPSGKLTMTFPRTVGQIPIYYNSKNTGRPYATQGIVDTCTVNENKCKQNAQTQFGEKYKSKYLDVLNTPLYPFGYGLSYTTFKYSNIRLNTSKLTKNSTIEAVVTVTNTGLYDGEEIVQLYIHDIVGSIARPVKELKSFQKVMIKKNQSVNVTFNITEDMLRFYNTKLEFKSEPGTFQVLIGTNSADLQSENFELLAP